ncbi:hypothetical protein K0U07_02735 [bacterium]|nr:hypothetical protein [bacterium]
MKKIVTFLAAMLCLFFLLPHAKKEVKLLEHEMYLKDHEFHFLAFHNKEDTKFLQKIYSMIDQEYDFFHIHLSIEKSEVDTIHQIQTYAKKKSKEHLITILEKINETPPAYLKENILKSLPPKSVVIELDDYCFFSQQDVLSILNKVLKDSISPICLYSNYTLAPAYTTNKQKIRYTNSLFKAAYAQDLLTSDLPKEYFLEKPLYILDQS